MKTYQKINTMYKRYQYIDKNCPVEKWKKMKNKIILGDFSFKEVSYLFDCPWEAYSKIDGTNSKIGYFPSTNTIKVEGKTENAQSQQGQFEYLEEIADKIKPIMEELFPKECAKFVPIKDVSNKIKYWTVDSNDETECIIPTSDGKYKVALEELPIYIYGEYFGSKIQKCGSRYIKNGHDFLVFDINIQGWWVPKEYRDEICDKLGLKTVPYLGNMTLREIENMVIDGFETKYQNASDPTLIEEGIVARPTVPLCNERGDRIIVKVKYADYVEWNNIRKEFSDEEFEEFNTWYHEYIENIKVS